MADYLSVRTLAWLGLEWHYCVVSAYILSLSLFKRGFHVLLMDKPSSLFMLCGCISISICSPIRRSMYPVFAERSFVSCSLMETAEEAKQETVRIIKN